MPFFNLLISVTLFHFLSNLPWLLSLEDAKIFAEKEDKLILLVFSGSDWCRNCLLLDHEVFNEPDFREFAESHLILLKADFPRKRKNQVTERQQAHNQKLAIKFNPQGEFPKVVLMDSKEKILFESSYRQGRKEQFLQGLKAMVRHE